MWNLLRPGIEPLFPALAVRLLTTVPPGKSRMGFFWGLWWRICPTALFQLLLVCWQSLGLLGLYKYHPISALKFTQCIPSCESWSLCPNFFFSYEYSHTGSGSTLTTSSLLEGLQRPYFQIKSHSPVLGFVLQHLFFLEYFSKINLFILIGD